MEQPVTYWMQLPLRRYADFGGRSPRAEYWWFALAYLIVLMIAAAIDGVLGTGFGRVGGLFYALVALAAFVPSLAVTIRRLHDLDRSGWWMLLAFIPLIGGIVLLVWFCSRGTVGPNRFGHDPLAGDVAEVFS